MSYTIRAMNIVSQLGMTPDWLPNVHARMMMEQSLKDTYELRSYFSTKQDLERYRQHLEAMIGKSLKR